MLPLSFATHTVAIVRAPLVSDGRNDMVRDWENATVTDVPGCVELPLTSDEVIRGRDAEMGSRRELLPAGTDVEGTDRIRLDGGRDFEIVGEPLPWTSPTGLLSHVEILIKRWEG